MKEEIIDTMSDVKVKEVPDQIILSIRYKGKYGEIGTYLAKLHEAGAKYASGPPFALIYEEETNETNADIEACLPIRKKITCGEFISTELKGGKALSMIHEGPYDTIINSYKFISDYAEENGIKLTPPSREIYIKGYGMILKGNPDKYITEIQFLTTKNP